MYLSLVLIPADFSDMKYIYLFSTEYKCSYLEDFLLKLADITILLAICTLAGKKGLGDTC